MKKLRVLIADDHALIREGLRKILMIAPEIEVVGEVEDGLQTLEFVRHHDIDIVLLDINMPRMNGIEACKAIKREKPEVHVVVLTIHDQEEYLFELIKSGISGYVLKDISPDQLISTIIGVSQGQFYTPPNLTAKLFNEFNRLSQSIEEPDASGLTDREIEVLQELAKGMSNKEIAEKLFISEKTVKNHLTNIFRKIGVSDRTQAALYAIKNRLVKL